MYISEFSCPRDPAAWAMCYEPNKRLEVEDGISLHLCNRPLLTAGHLVDQQRPPSPLSDLEDEIEEGIPLSLTSTCFNKIDIKGLSTVSLANLHTITTNYDPEMDKNKVFPCLADKPSRVAWTLKERLVAENAETPENMEALELKVRSPFYFFWMLDLMSFGSL